MNTINILTNDDNLTFNFSIKFDIYGNLYFDGQEHNNHSYFSNNDNKTYQININGKNQPIAEQGLYAIIDNTNKRKKGSIKTLDEQTSLRSQVRKKKEQEEELDKEEENNDYEVTNDDDKDIDVELEGNRKKYYYEDNDIIEYDIEKLNDFDDSEDEEFTFLSANNDIYIDVNEREYGDISALYDTYIYNNNEIVYKTKAPNNEILYRIKIILNNSTMSLRSICDNDIFYKLKIDSGGQIEFIRL
jgi:hypothetical protein